MGFAIQVLRAPEAEDAMQYQWNGVSDLPHAILFVPHTGLGMGLESMSTPEENIFRWCRDRVIGHVNVYLELLTPKYIIGGKTLVTFAKNS